MGLESKVLPFGAVFHTLRYEVYSRYLFDPLFPQGMKVETSCSGIGIAVYAGLRLVFVEKVFYTSDIVSDSLCHYRQYTGHADIQGKSIRA
jgi:hypothetical protein